MPIFAKVRCSRQQEIIKLIAEQNADYVITLNKNQGSLYKSVEQLFKEAIRTGFQGIEHSAYHTTEQTHGREEIRHYQKGGYKAPHFRSVL